MKRLVRRLWRAARVPGWPVSEGRSVQLWAGGSGVVLAVFVLFSLSACQDKLTTVEVPAEPRCEPVAEMCNGLDDDCDTRIDEGVTNACGGCDALDPAPLEQCGACGGGTVICATPNTTLCVDEIPQNDCGGCEPLTAQPGGPCGTCDTGTLTCEGADAVVCEGEMGDVARNACGGCLELEAELGAPCGTCDGGEIGCDGTESTRCVDDPGPDVLNICGLCGPLPEEGCDLCGDGVRGDGEECDDGNLEGMDGCSPECELEAAWARIEPGTFTMGSPTEELGRRSSERQHDVTLTRPYLIRAHEITRAEWSMIMNIPSPALFEGCGEQCPVARVSWWDALEFANRLSELAGLQQCYVMEDCQGEPGTGCAPEEVSCSGGFSCQSVTFVGLDCTGYRLPVEAEWEYAARGGTQGAFSSGEIVHTSRAPLDPNLNTVGWYAGNSTVSYGGGQDCSEWFAGADTCGPQPIGAKLPNAWGVFDMHGNVWEWVWDGDGAYPQEPVIDPLGPQEADTRVRRGGSWSSPSQFCRSAFRFGNDPTFRSNGLGFRIARTAP